MTPLADALEPRADEPHRIQEGPVRCGVHRQNLVLLHWVTPRTHSGQKRLGVVATGEHDVAEDF